MKDYKNTISQTESEKEKLHSGLYKVTQELIKQTNITIDQSNTINILSNEIHRLETNLTDYQKKDNSKRNQEILMNETESSKDSKDNQLLNTDDIEEKLNEVCKMNNINVRFTKKSDGKFMFGSKMIQIKSASKGKIILEIGGGSFTIAEFLKLFASQEEKKIRRSIPSQTLNEGIANNKRESMFEYDENNSKKVILKNLRQDKSYEKTLNRK